MVGRSSSIFFFFSFLTSVLLLLFQNQDFFADNYTRNAFWVMRVIGYPPLQRGLDGGEEVIIDFIVS